MRYEFDDGRNLIIVCDPIDQGQLREDRENDPERFTSDSYLWDALEDLTCNSDLEWTRPEIVGALTDAPMLGLGKLNDGDDSVDVPEEVWAFMDYQVRSPQDDLADHGRCVWQYGGKVEAMEAPNVD